MPGVKGRSGGRNIKTVAQHKLDDTFQKCRHAGFSNPEPTPGAPDPPEPIDDELAQREWDRLMWAFNDMGYLTKIDAFVVYQHCHLFAEVERIARKAREADASLTILNENVGHIDKKDLPQFFHELIEQQKLISKYTDQLRNGRNAIRLFLVEHGLTPASRGRIKLPMKHEAADAFTAFQQRRFQNAPSSDFPRRL
jgi:phage terminase small subunit